MCANLCSHLWGTALGSTAGVFLGLCQWVSSSCTDLFSIERDWQPVCPTICVMFLASHQALLSGNSAKRLMCAGGGAEHSARNAQPISAPSHITAPGTGQGEVLRHINSPFPTTESVIPVNRRSIAVRKCVYDRELKFQRLILTSKHKIVKDITFKPLGLLD